MYDDGLFEENEDDSLQVYIVKEKESNSVKIKHAPRKIGPQVERKRKYIVHNKGIPKISKYVVYSTSENTKEKA